MKKIKGVLKVEGQELPVVFEREAPNLDPKVELPDKARKLACYLNLHVWDGKRCINCGKVR